MRLIDLIPSPPDPTTDAPPPPPAPAPIFGPKSSLRIEVLPNIPHSSGVCTLLHLGSKDPQTTARAARRSPGARHLEKRFTTETASCRFRTAFCEAGALKDPAPSGGRGGDCYAAATTYASYPRSNRAQEVLSSASNLKMVIWIYLHQGRPDCVCNMHTGTFEGAFPPPWTRLCTTLHHLN